MAPCRSAWISVPSLGLALGLLWTGGAAAEQRQVYSAQSPGWLQAVGKLQVPGSRWLDGKRQHQLEDCSATLVSDYPDTAADTVVTAWHCLEYYNDLSRPLIFTLLPNSQAAITREVYRVADGGGMHADWAILKMHRPVTAEQVTAIRPHPDRAETQRPISMAGYSRDSGLGARGELLTYDAQCHILQQQAAAGHTDCQAYKGASGGAVVQLSPEGLPLLSGVISRGDSEALSIYVPVDRFRTALSSQLRN